MNAMTIFARNDFARVQQVCPKSNEPYKGYFYVLALDNDEVKIGSTQNPTVRLNTLVQELENYGKRIIFKVAISEAHYGYAKNEYALHIAFEDQRVPNTELFRASFNEIVRFSMCNLCEEAPPDTSRADKLIDTVQNEIKKGLTAMSRAIEKERALTPLTVDDYIMAADLVSSCRDDLLPFLVKILQRAGFSVSYANNQLKENSKTINIQHMTDD